MFSSFITSPHIIRVWFAVWMIRRPVPDVFGPTAGRGGVYPPPSLGFFSYD